MKFTSTLVKGKLVRRYKRFFADIKVNNQIITAHCPNTGSMMGLLCEGNETWLTKNDDPKREPSGWGWDGPTWRGLRVLY